MSIYLSPAISAMARELPGFDLDKLETLFQPFWEIGQGVAGLLTLIRDLPAMCWFWHVWLTNTKKKISNIGSFTPEDRWLCLANLHVIRFSFAVNVSVPSIQKGDNGLRTHFAEYCTYYIAKLAGERDKELMDFVKKFGNLIASSYTNSSLQQLREVSQGSSHEVGQEIKSRLQDDSETEQDGNSEDGEGFDIFQILQLDHETSQKVVQELGEEFWESPLTELMQSMIPENDPVPYIDEEMRE
jgi:hypothetical protein